MDQLSTKAPWHLWVIGIVSLLWNGFGAFDYVMTMTKNAEYLSNFTEDQLTYFLGLPAVFTTLWAIAIWSAVLGSILLLLRKVWAAPVFLVSLVAMLICSLWTYGISRDPVMMAPVHYAFSAVIAVIAVLLWQYAKAMAKRGILR